VRRARSPQSAGLVLVGPAMIYAVTTSSPTDVRHFNSLSAPPVRNNTVGPQDKALELDRSAVSGDPRLSTYDEFTRAPYSKEPCDPRHAGNASFASAVHGRSGSRYTAAMISSDIPIWQEPVRGFYADPGQFLALSGLDFLRSEGSSLPPPIGYLCGLHLSAVEPGSTAFTMPVTDWLLSPQGAVSGATLSFLVDAPLGCTVQTALPPATSYSTAEVSLKFLRTVVPRSGTLTARGRLIHAGKSIAISLVEVTDDEGRLLAVTSTRCSILPRLAAPSEIVEQALKNPPRLTEPEWPSPHPYQRPVKGEVLAQEIWDRMSGLEVMRALIKGDLPAPPLRYLCGIVPLDAEEGRIRLKMPASEWFCAPVPGRLYGGATAFLAGTAIDTAVQTTVPAGTAFAPVDLKVYFLRPVSPDGRDLVALGTVIHRGRSVAIGTSQVFDADRKKGAVASGSALILPGRPATVTTELTPPHPLDAAGED
jgi:uncharacterized protein (TIGR00369 family)